MSDGNPPGETNNDLEDDEAGAMRSEPTPATGLPPRVPTVNFTLSDTLTATPSTIADLPSTDMQSLLTGPAAKLKPIECDDVFEWRGAPVPKPPHSPLALPKSATVDETACTGLSPSVINDLPSTASVVSLHLERQDLKPIENSDVFRYRQNAPKVSAPALTITTPPPPSPSKATSPVSPLIPLAPRDTQPKPLTPSPPAETKQLAHSPQVPTTSPVTKPVSPMAMPVTDAAILVTKDLQTKTIEQAASLGKSLENGGSAIDPFLSCQPGPISSPAQSPKPLTIKPTSPFSKPKTRWMGKPKTKRTNEQQARVRTPVMAKPSPTISRDSRTPGSRTPGSRTPGSRTPGSRTPGSGTPGSRTPGSRTPGSRTPGSRTPGKRTPGSRTPGSRTPRSRTPGSRTPRSPAKGPFSPNAKPSMVKSLRKVTPDKKKVTPGRGPKAPTGSKARAKPTSAKRTPAAKPQNKPKETKTTGRDKKQDKGNVESPLSKYDSVIFGPPPME